MNTIVKGFCLKALLVVLCAAKLQAQEQPQKPLFPPQKLSEVINTAYPEINPVLSPDGNELFFVRANHPQNTYGERGSEDIWYSKRSADGQWTEAVRIPELNMAIYNAVVAVADDGSLLINGVFNKKGTYWKKRGFSVVSRNSEGKWSKPTPLKVAGFSKMNRGLYTTAYMSADRKQLMMSFSKRFNSKRSDIFVSQLKNNGKYSRPKKIKLPYGDTERAPFLSADGRQMYFISDIFGSFDVFVAERQDDSYRRWSEPKPVMLSNTNEWESYFRTNTSGSMAWFAAREGKENPDLYSVKLFEDNPFIVVKGRVLDQKTNQPIENLTDLSVLVNDSLDQSLEIQENGFYRIKLPLGKDYQLKPQLQYHQSVASQLEAASLQEYTEREMDLYLAPWQVVLVKGKIVDRRSQEIVPALANPRIFVNGQSPDSLVVNAATGEYSLWLPFGKNYQLQVEASGYKAEPQALQLEKVNAYRVLNRDLLANKINTATVQGRLIDRKTGDKFPAGVVVQVVLNDTLQLATADSLGTYEVKVPLGSVHVLSAKAEGYYPMTEMIDLKLEDKPVKVYKDLYLAPIEVGQSIRLNNVFFETGKSTLMPASFPELDRVVTFLKENPKMRIEIAGHTDNKGSVSLNNKLSAARAASVAKYITEKGLEKGQLSSKGYGSTKPEADNKTEDGRARNRRVEFTILEIKD